MADKPSVLFVCVHNAGRSQMAAASCAPAQGRCRGPLGRLRTRGPSQPRRRRSDGRGRHRHHRRAAEDPHRPKRSRPPTS